MNLGFVVLYVRDMDKVKAFYTDLLGLTVVAEVSGPTFVTLRPSGGSLLALQDATASLLPPGRETASGSVELSFEVDDIDGTWKRWHEAGVEFSDRTIGDVVRTLFPRKRSRRPLSLRLSLHPAGGRPTRKCPPGELIRSSQ